MDNLKEEIVSKERKFDGVVIDVEHWQVRLPDGSLGLREVALHKGAAAVVPVDEQGRVPMVRQFRAPIGRVTLEIPAGRLEPGEEPRAAAARELAEETSLVASDLRHLVRVYGSPGFTDEKTDVFLATGLAQGPACPDEGEFLRVAWLPATDVVRAVLAGAIQDSKTVCGVLAARAAGVLE